MSVVRTKVLGLVDVIMRVPSLFIIDEILKISMGLPSSSTPPSAQTAAGAAGSTSHAEMLVNLTLNATAAVANAMDAATTAPGAIGSPEDSLKDDIEFYKFISLTTLKFLLCLFGKSLNQNRRQRSLMTMTSTSTHTRRYVPTFRVEQLLP